MAWHIIIQHIEARYSTAQRAPDSRTRSSMSDQMEERGW
jgi:hypothetical protein